MQRASYTIQKSTLSNVLRPPLIRRFSKDLTRYGVEISSTNAR